MQFLRSLALFALILLFFIFARAEKQGKIADDVEVIEEKTKESEARQFGQMYAPPMYQPNAGGFNFIRRQFTGGVEALGDIVMLGMIGLPILGLLTMGGMSVANFLGLGASSRKTSGGNKRNRRGLVDKAAGAVQFVRNLWDIMEDLEKSFEKYGIEESDCRLRTVCEAHGPKQKQESWSQDIINLMKQQKELQKKEILPVARFLFSNYVEAANLGERGANCPLSFPECPHELSDYLSPVEDQKDNEVEVEM